MASLKGNYCDDGHAAVRYSGSACPCCELARNVTLLREALDRKQLRIDELRDDLSAANARLEELSRMR